MHPSSIRSVASENLSSKSPPSRNHLWPLVASLNPGGPAPLDSSPLSIKCHGYTPHNSNPTFSSLAITPFPSSNSIVGLSLRLISSMSSCIPTPSSRALLHISLSIICLLGVAAGRPTQNITIEVPNGTTTHGNSFCIPPTWVDIASFLLFNYISHGATVVSYPGERSYFTVIIVLVTIFSPKIGVKRAFNLIFRHPRLSRTAKNDLEVAARSGALCMLVRSSSWKPQKGDNIKNARIEDKTSHQDRNTSRLGPSANETLPTYVPIYL